MDMLIMTPSSEHVIGALACLAAILIARTVDRRSSARRDASDFADAEAAVAATRTRLAQMRRHHNQLGA